MKMSPKINISESLYQKLKRASQRGNRSISQQLEHWARIGKSLEENPDLSIEVIQEIFIGLQELDFGKKSDYIFSEFSGKN
jgi:predicted CopG family antitoxin